MRNILVSIVVIAMVGAVGWYWSKIHTPLSEQTLWYQMIWHGENVGYMREDYRIEGQYFKIINETSVKTISQGKPFGFAETKQLVFEASPPYRFLNSYYRYQTNDQLKETKLVAEGQTISGSRMSDSEIEPVSVQSDELFLSDFRQLNNWVRSAPKVKDKLSYTIPEISTGELTSVNYEVSAYENDLYEIVTASSSDPTKRQTIINESGDVTSYSYGDIISLEYVADPDDIITAGDVDLYTSKLLALDMPLGNAEKLNSVEMAISNWLLPYLSEDNRQIIDGNKLMLNANVSAIANDGQKKIDSQQKFSPVTKQKLFVHAMTAIMGETSKLSQLTALRAYVSDYLADGARVSVTTIESLLDNPEGDCTEHTQLFNALAQVLGYETRTVNGLVYLGDKERGFAGHQWSEVLVDGYWISFDPTWNINSLTATHIRLNQEKAAALYRLIKAEDSVSLSLISKN